MIPSFHARIRLGLLALAAKFIRRASAGLGCGAALAVAAGLLSGCASVPLPQPRAATTIAMTNKDDTSLGRMVGTAAAQYAGLSGLYPLERGLDAFVARMALADAAERSLDVQYYIWHGDNTGRLLAERLLKAADRGVRVRVLLDDIGTAPSDRNLLALDRHPNIDVRLFNPVSARSARGLGTLFEFSRVNRRMHNKSFTADNQATIVGGRNIGDEYFAAQPDLEFADLDVLAIGPVVREVSVSFDLYWNSRSSVPITAVSKEQLAADFVARQRQELAAHTLAMTNSPYVQALRETRLVEELRERKLDFAWGRAWTVYDHPDKVCATTSNA